MKTTPFITILIILILSLSCERILPGYKYIQGSLPETPVNLSDFNTEYDDYNSTLPISGELIPFCFSTNRRNQNDFDIIYMPMNVNFDNTSGILKVTYGYDNRGVLAEYYEVIRTGLDRIKTDGNEFGPNMIIGQSIDKFKFTLLYTTDLTGNSQINFISNRTVENFSDPKEVKFLNSEFDDMYPTFNSERSRIYFCSNRNGSDFDIFHVDVNPKTDIDLLLSENSSYQILLDSSLSGNSDDKCPFIFENRIVFASDRAGGFGGFDLYYSNFENGEWSEPVNFGEKINTGFDEYRPILIDEGVSLSQTMMVFSSNRAGGKGGFDLYFAGIEKD
jgi:hypothetical protein